MTVLIGLHVPGTIYIASDTRVTSGGHAFPGFAKKIGHGTEGRAIAAAGPQALGQVLISAFFGENGPRQVGDFGAFLRSVTTDYLKTVSDTDRCSGLLVMGGRLYDFDSTGATLQMDIGTLQARGSGSDYAMGAGHATRERD